MADTVTVLEGLGYSLVVEEEPGVEPGYSSLGFEDIHPGFAGTRLAGRRLYEHQARAFQELVQGRNVVLVSGTGSGKTEAWVAYVAARLRAGGGVRVLAVYPTLALAWDQLARLREYARALGVGVVGVDSLAKRRERSLRASVASAAIVATNPAMLFHELKKHLLKPGGAVLSTVFESLGLLVVDELDYYDPRSLALMLGVIEVLSSLRRGGLQVAVLTATLSNPGDLASFLTAVTGRETAIVGGKPFRRPNRVIVVLGKELEQLRRALAERLSGNPGIPSDIARAINDPEVFKREAHRVIGYLQATGVDAPSPAVDVVEILEVFARGEVEPPGVTLVFTPSISSAERIGRALRERLGSERDRVAVHHHLVSKEARAEIEERARRGELRLVISPRTLVQGIDIGTVVRVVHVGLPLSQREFVQREGRKGRRSDIPYTETVIVPYTRWDRELLLRGFNAFSKWVSMGPEKTIVNTGNHYKALFTGAAKLLSPLLRGEELDKAEEEALRAAGVLRGKSVDLDALQHLWNRLGFYEYGPPYGVKRVLETGAERRELEEIGRCDLVEKFQPGCIDYAEDAVVVDLVKSQGKRGVVVRVVEERVRDVLAGKRIPWMLEAVEEYRRLKEAWGEEARLLRDLASGLVSSEVVDIVYPPRRGFGLLRKRPHRCVWIVYSSRPRATVGGDGRIRIYREVGYIALDAPVAGEYRDYTYGLVVEGPQGFSPEELRLGLAVLNLYLRRRHGIPLGLIKYSVYAIGEKRLVELHEESAAGILDKIDWSSVAVDVEGFVGDELDEILLLGLDEYAYQALEALGFDWGRAARVAAVIASLVASKQVVEISLFGTKVRIPRPSRALGVGSIAVLAHPVNLGGLGVKPVLAALAYYDGSEARSAVDIVFPGRRRPPPSLLDLELRIVSDVEYEGFKIVSFEPSSDAVDLRRAGLRILAGLVEERGISVSRLLRERLGVEVGDPGWIAEHVEGWSGGSVGLHELVSMLERGFKSAGIPGRVEQAVKRYVESYAEAVYLAYLATSRIPKKAVRGR